MKRSRARSSEAIEFARTERATANEFANTVWQWVRNRRICNQKFRREYPIPPYTADFCCVELKLILEIDGAEHFFNVLREPSLCLRKIEEEVTKKMREIENPSPPAPLPGARRGGERIARGRSGTMGRRLCLLSLGNTADTAVAHGVPPVRERGLNGP